MQPLISRPPVADEEKQRIREEYMRLIRAGKIDSGLGRVETTRDPDSLENRKRIMRAKNNLERGSKSWLKQAMEQF